MNNIGKSKVINIITQALCLQSEKVTPCTPLTNRLQIDELDIEHICTEIEREFGIQIEHKNPEQFNRVNDFIDAIDHSISSHYKSSKSH